MATERLSMRKLREILRQKWTLARSHRQVAASLQVSIGTVTSVLRRATHAGLDWAQVQALPDASPGGPLYGAPATPGAPGRGPTAPPSTPKRKKARRHLGTAPPRVPGAAPGATATPGSAISTPVARPTPALDAAGAPAGEKIFVDYAGQKPAILDPTTGEVIESSSSSGSSARATIPTPRRRRPSSSPTVGEPPADVRLLWRVSTAVVCDQLKAASHCPAGTSRASSARTRSFAAPVAPRSSRPGRRSRGTRRRSRWPCKWRNGGSWRGSGHERFFSLAALNVRIRELLDALNRRRMRTTRRAGGSSSRASTGRAAPAA